MRLRNPVPKVNANPFPLGGGRVSENSTVFLTGSLQIFTIINIFKTTPCRNRPWLDDYHINSIFYLEMLQWWSLSPPAHASWHEILSSHLGWCKCLLTHTFALILLDSVCFGLLDPDWSFFKILFQFLKSSCPFFLFFSSCCIQWRLGISYTWLSPIVPFCLKFLETH